MKHYLLNGSNLSLQDVFDIAHAKDGEIKIKIDPTAQDKMAASRKVVLNIIENDVAVYGINTGFGALAHKKIDRNSLKDLQYNLIRSHCTGVGKPFDRATARAIMLCRLNCLIQGFSGVSPEIVTLLITFLELGITPIIPEKGSVGASGDLAPLAHVALCLIGEGEVTFQNTRQTTLQVLKNLKLSPAELGPKDGLALINGTSVMLALGALALVEAEVLMKTADIAGCLTLDAVRGTPKAFDSRISQLKPHPGQIIVSRNLNKIIHGSEIINSHPEDGKVQDPYSLRCIPQVHGACRQTLEHAREVLEIEFDSVTDNPLVFAENNEVISGGNFHGEALAMCLDYLAIGLAEIANISERRVEKMMNPHFSDLPAFLAKDSGLNSGLMIAHVTTAALVSENKVLSHPASVDSVPTSTDKEDHVSMGVTSGRKLHQIIENVRYSLAIEFLCNTQGLTFLRPLKTSPGLENVYALIRKFVPAIAVDRTFHQDIETISGLIQQKEILDSVEKFTGKLD